MKLLFEKGCHHLLLVAALVLFGNARIEAFVDIQPVRKHQLQSTATPTILEPAHVLTDAYTRNPFAGLPHEGPGKEDWNLHFLGSPSRLVARFCQSEQSRQQIQKNITAILHHFLRDTGALRSIMDFLVTIGTPSIALENPSIVPAFLRLSQECIRIPYGDHELQRIDMYLPRDNKNQSNKPKGLLYFIHGGAWGSGLPWMYRLVAQPFLEKDIAVAIVGYRTYPDGNIRDQVEDLELACKVLTKTYPELCLEGDSQTEVCVMGHSSGAHIAMQMVVNRMLHMIDGENSCKADVLMKIDTFIGISAPYEIASHYDFEKMRGLEELPPMKAACGNTVETLSDYSPVLHLYRRLISRTDHDRKRILRKFPRVAMLHGILDETVPFSSTRQAAHLLTLLGIRECHEFYFSDTGHSDTMFEIMFGGKSRDIVIGWLERTLKGQQMRTFLRPVRYLSSSMQQTSSTFAEQVLLGPSKTARKNASAWEIEPINVE